MADHFRRPGMAGIFLVLLLTVFGLGSARASLRINEIMASNGGLLRDAEGEYDDWVEIYNPDQWPVDAAGMYLTDDPAVPTKWQVPTDRPEFTTIPPQGYLLIWLDGDTADPGLHASFALDSMGDDLELYDANGETLIDAVSFDEQRSDLAYGRVADAPDQWAYLIAPTPGGPNATAYEGMVADPEFSRSRGFCTAPFTVTLTTATPDAAIFYTTDGPSPLDSTHRIPTGRPYTGPIPIHTTTCLRAVAVRPNWVPANPVTHTYIFLDDVLEQSSRPPGWPRNWGHTGTGDYEMDPEVVYAPRYRDTIKADLQSVPTLSLATQRDNWFGSGGQGIYLRGELEERPVSAELIVPGGEGFQINAAVMIVGGSSVNRWKMDKLSMRLKFKGEYGPPKLRYPVFGPNAAEEFNTLVVDARMNNSWAYGGGVGVSRPGLGQRDLAQYTRDQFASDLQLALGGHGTRGRHVHLYLNGLYWGLYWLHERPDEHYAASYLGDRAEDYDVLKHSAGRAINGSAAKYNEMFSLANSGPESADRYSEIRQVLDVPDLINYILVNYYIGNTDWAHHNWYASRSRVDPASRWHYHSWDAEHVMEGLHDNATGRNNSGGPTRLHHQLARNAEYRMLFADHVHRHFFNGGVLSPEGAAALYQVRLDEVDRAVVGESARWGDNHRSTPYTRDIDWVRERDWLLGTYFPQRTQVVLDQIRSRGWYPHVDAPVFQVNGVSQHGGHVRAADMLSMASAGDPVWYTLDGTDPRIPGTEAGPVDETTLVSEDAAKRVLVPNGPVSGAWRGGAPFDDSTWTAGKDGVGYERSAGYEPFIGIDVQGRMYNRATTCLIRIPFRLTAADLADVGGLLLKVRYDDGFVAYLNGTEVARRNFQGQPAWNSSASSQNSDSDAVNLETISISGHIDTLQVGGNVLAVQALNISTTSSDLLFSAQLASIEGFADGAEAGVAATANRYTDPITLDRSAVVKARALGGTTWSALSEAVFAVGPVAESLRISEIMYHPADTDDPNSEFIELTNVGAETIDLNLVRFTDGIDYTFDPYELPPGGCCLLVRDRLAFEARYGADLPVAGQYDGSLRNGGERIELVDAAEEVIQSFEFDDGWYTLTDGLGFSLTVREPGQAGTHTLNDKAAWEPSDQPGGSPGIGS